MSELKPCPFCGESESLYVEHMDGTTKRPAHRVYCDNCGASHRLTDRGDHIENWNRRAEPDQHPCCWAPSIALKELERGMNNAPCILTDSPAEFNDTPLYRDPTGTIAAQQQVLNGLAEILGVEAGDVDGLISEVDRLKEQHFTDLCNSVDVKRLISIVAFPDNYADQDFSEMAKRVLAKMEQNTKALAGGEAG